MTTHQPRIMSNTYTTDQRQGAARGVRVTWAIVITILTLGYTLPWMIATIRGSRNSAAPPPMS